MQALGSLLRVPSALPASFRAVSGVLWQLQHHIALYTTTTSVERSGAALLVLQPASAERSSLEEAVRLAESLAGGETPDYAVVGSVSRSRPSPATFFGRGQVESVQARVAATQPARVFVNHALSGVQQRNLERALGRPVLDRVGLILEIFGQRARTAEARLQVELAALEYRSSRLVRVADPTTGKRTAFGAAGEASEVVSARERGRSGSGGGLGGAGGQGESELQLQRRRVAERRRQLRARLEEVRRTRAVQRAARRRSGKPQIAIVGYTNAGKSSLLAALAGMGAEEAGAQDRLFATLDPTLRRVLVPRSGRDVILSDTVGFISDLPTQLVEAFRATLEEVTEADLLLHVLDASSPQALRQRSAVLGVLRGLGVSEERLRGALIEVWNKVDQVDDPAGAEGGRAVAEQDVQDGGFSPGASKSAAETPSGDGDGHAAAGQGAGLPAALAEALDEAAAADGYRPPAVATSVLHRRGLRQLMEAIESKVQALGLDSRAQRPRRSAKMRGTNEMEAQEAELVRRLVQAG